MPKPSTVSARLGTLQNRATRSVPQRSGQILFEEVSKLLFEHASVRFHYKMGGRARVEKYMTLPAFAKGKKNEPLQ
jgi:hypothetical protein